MRQPTKLSFARAQGRALPSILALTLGLAACGGDDKGSENEADTGTGGQDASAGDMDSGHQHGNDGGTTDGATSDAQTSSDGGGSSDAGSADGGSDAGGSDASMDAAALAYAQGGKVSALDAAASDAQGAALMVRVDGGTLVSLQVSGLVPSTMYPAHVHNLPCAMQAGGHYQHVADGGVNNTNEVWPSFTTDDAGQARSFVSVDKVLRADAVAIVVHDHTAGNPKLLCADLVSTTPTTLKTTGAPKPLAAADAGGVGGITGTASLTRTNDGTTQVSLDVQNLKADTQYMVHVHDQPCAFANGGGHYKFDYGNTGTVESNEIWLNFTSTATGAGSKSVKVDHSARAEAQAIVIHAMDNTRLACIDLKP